MQVLFVVKNNKKFTCAYRQFSEPSVMPEGNKGDTSEGEIDEQTYFDKIRNF